VRMAVDSLGRVHLVYRTPRQPVGGETTSLHHTMMEVVP